MCSVTAPACTQPHICRQGLSEAPQHDGKQRHPCGAARSSLQGPGSQQAWGDAKKSHPQGAVPCRNRKTPGPHVWGCMTHCHREGKSQAIHFPRSTASGYSTSDNFKGRSFSSL